MKRLLCSFILFIICLALFSDQLPLAEVIPETTYVHDRILIDNYAWLKDKTRSDEKVLNHLQKENDLTLKYMEPTADLQQTLFNEFIARTDYDDMSVPVKIDSFYYYYRSEKGKEYDISCRKKNSLGADEEIILDQNQLAAGKDYFDLQEFEISSDHNFLAFTTDTTGFENYQLYLKDLRSGLIIESFPFAVDNVVWTADDRTIIYSTIDETGRTDKVFIHDIFSALDDQLIFQEEDQAFYIWLGRSRSKKYILLTITSKITSEVWYLDCADLTSGLKLIQPRIQAMEYYVHDHNDNFYIRTNADGAFNFKIMQVPIKNPGKNYWQEFIAHRDSVYLDFDVFQDYLVRIERYKGKKTISLTDQDNHLIKHLSSPGISSIIYQGNNPDFNSTTYRFSYESMHLPLTTMEYDLQTGSIIQLKRKKVENYEPADYRSELIYAPAADGTMIPITILYNLQLLSSTEHPLILNGYGAYGDAEDPYFSSSRVSLLDRGIIYATAHVRGGGELGYEWYEAGKMDRKMNTFTDFITCADFLVDKGYTNYDKLVIQGGSAGGLLIGAVLNLRPDICRAAVADVPFVDLINSMLDPTLSATVTEYEEWGNPNIKSEFEYMYSYCPYQNIQEQDYPDILALAGFYDSRVNYWEPAKWIARIRELKTDENTQLLYTYMDSGHSGTSGRQGYFREIAFRYAYILSEVDIKE